VLFFIDDVQGESNFFSPGNLGLCHNKEGSGQNVSPKNSLENNLPNSSKGEKDIKDSSFKSSFDFFFCHGEPPWLSVGFGSQNTNHDVRPTANNKKT
jgi:hypothetical protein